MAFRISKPERAELNSFSKRLAKEQVDLEAALAEAAETIEAAYEKLNGAIDTYNGVLADAHSYLEDISTQAQTDFDDKSERWQEGDRGEATREWIDGLDNILLEMDEIENFVYDLPTLELSDFAELIDGLEDEPSY
jgi:hypothetical protein